MPPVLGAWLPTRKKLYRRIHDRLTKTAGCTNVRYEPNRRLPREVLADVDPRAFLGQDTLSMPPVFVSNSAMVERDPTTKSTGGNPARTEASDGIKTGPSHSMAPFTCKWNVQTGPPSGGGQRTVKTSIRIGRSSDGSPRSKMQ